MSDKKELTPEDRLKKMSGLVERIVQDINDVAEQLNMTIAEVAGVLEVIKHGFLEDSRMYNNNKKTETTDG